MLREKRSSCGQQLRRPIPSWVDSRKRRDTPGHVYEDIDGHPNKPRRLGCAMTTTQDSAATQQTGNTENMFHETFNNPPSTSASATPTIPSTTGPVGEAGLPPARPSSTYTATSSRIGASTVYGSRRTGGSSVYPSDNTSPPSTATSRTHVPNIISSAFLRPISAKRAHQQDQSLPPLSPPPQQLPIARPSSESGARSHRHRNSNASIVTVEGQQRPLIDPDAPPLPTSRGTGVSSTTQDNRINTMESGTSRAFLQHPRTPAPLQLDSQTKAASLQAQKSPKSSRSLATSWGRTSRSGRYHEHSTSREGHTKLASSPPSPAYPVERKQVTVEKTDLGRNYEYFNGNATFFLRGRLINTRQRPLNLLTAFFAILPAILFFIFSYVSLPSHDGPLANHF